MRYVVIPTRFERESIWPLIEQAAGVAEVILVHTEPDHNEVIGVTNVHDYRRNIQHWWNSGLSCAHDGPALVMNDDLEVTAEVLEQLFEALERVDLVYVPGRGRKAATPISGWCWGVHPNQLRPDPDFVWWYGDDDLFNRAEFPLLVNVDVKHIAREDMGAPEEFREQVKLDRELYQKRWA